MIKLTYRSVPISKATAKKVKFVDDGSVAVSINLKLSLVTDHTKRPKPLAFQERNELILPPENNLLQAYIADTEQFAIDNQMVINKKKTQVICFNKTRKWNFPPEVLLADRVIDCVTQVKLVGVTVTDDLKWVKNTEYICEKAMNRIWVLRRMKNIGLEAEYIFDTYIKEIRSVLELAVPVWHSSLTKKLSNEIERVQKIAFRIILGDHYNDYDVACTLLETETLEMRR